MYEEEVANREVARKIYQLRTKAGMSQAELARRVARRNDAIGDFAA